MTDAAAERLQDAMTGPSPFRFGASIGAVSFLLLWLRQRGELLLAQAARRERNWPSARLSARTGPFGLAFLMEGLCFAAWRMIGVSHPLAGRSVDWFQRNCPLRFGFSESARCFYLPWPVHFAGSGLASSPGSRQRERGASRSVQQQLADCATTNRPDDVAVSSVTLFCCWAGLPAAA